MYMSENFIFKFTYRHTFVQSNLQEHYFDYIDEDIQTADHTVLPFPRGGTMTRDENHKTARPYTRDIM